MGRPFTDPRRWSVVRMVQVVAAVGLTIWALVPVVTVTAKPLALQPFPDSVEYADGAWQLGHGHGYVTFFNERDDAFGGTPRPPRFPFGASAALAPFAAVIDRFPQGIQLGSRVYSVMYVLVLVAAAWRLGGPFAAAIAALLVGLSPFARLSASLILSDALGALLAVGTLLALTYRSRVATGMAGALAGAACCVRLESVVSLPAVALAVSGRRRALVVACAAPFLVALALYQWQTFGSPLRTGYHYWVPGWRPFAFSYALSQAPHVNPFVYPDNLNGGLFGFLCPCGINGPSAKLPNILFYPSVAAGLFWVFAPPLTGLVGLVAMVRDRLSPPARFALITVALTLVGAVFYTNRTARVIAPAASLLLVYGAVGISSLLTYSSRSFPRVINGALRRTSAYPAQSASTGGA